MKPLLLALLFLGCGKPTERDAERETPKPIVLDTCWMWEPKPGQISDKRKDGDGETGKGER